MTSRISASLTMSQEISPPAVNPSCWMPIAMTSSEETGSPAQRASSTGAKLVEHGSELRKTPRKPTLVEQCLYFGEEQHQGIVVRAAIMDIYLWAPTKWAHLGRYPFHHKGRAKAYVPCGLRRFPHEGFRWCCSGYRNHLIPSPFSGCGPIAAQLDPWFRTLLWPDCTLSGGA